MRLGRALLAGVLACLGFPFPSPALAACGPAPAPCEIAGGHYHLRLPAESGGAPVLMFLHGYGGRGGATIDNPRIAAPFLARGYAVIAPDGVEDPASGVRRWNFGRRPAARDDRAFLRAVLADAGRRFGVDTGRVLLAGFSNGGFMTTYIACETPDAFAAYAPVSGGFWRPHPAACAGPVRLLHTHGWTDVVVPLEGRPLGGGRFLQGDIFAGLERFRAASGCAGPMPGATGTEGAFWTRRWTDCAPGGALGLALFPGGHAVPEGWADMAADWFETAAGG